MSQFVVLELIRFIALLFVAALLGSLFELTSAFLFIAASLYFFLYLRKLSHLDSWMRSKSKDVPEASGIWGEIFNHIFLLQKRNRNQKKKLASALTRFQQITAALPDGVVILDYENHIEWSNESAKRLLGIRTPHDNGQPVTNLIRLPVFARYLMKASFDEPLSMHAPDNDFVNLNIRIVPYGKGQKMLLARDMTRLYRLEQARKDFIANASHELRTPLTVVNGYLETLTENDAVDAQSLKSVIEAMTQQSHRMQNIVEDLLLLSRLENSSAIEEHDRVDINQLMNDVAADARKLSGVRAHVVNVDVNCNKQLIGDYKELYSALSNLVFNAVHYTPDQGHITLSCVESSDALTLSVKDTGPGIPPQHIPRLTERFYRVDNARSRDSGGTGLGLAIVKHVLMRHSGRLSIESIVGKGSVFSCVFPASQLANSQQDVTKVS